MPHTGETAANEFPACLQLLYVLELALLSPLPGTLGDFPLRTLILPIQVKPILHHRDNLGYPAQDIPTHNSSMVAHLVNEELAARLLGIIQHEDEGRPKG